MKLVRVISTAFVNGYRTIKTKMGQNIVETGKAANPFGFDSNPPEKLIAIVAETKSNDESVIVGYLFDKALSSLNVGDSLQYATDASGAIKSSIILRNDGTAEMLGTGDFMVRYSKLEEGYNQLKSDHDTLVSLYNSHIHLTTATVGATPTPGVIAPTVSTGQPSTGDITGAKIDEIKTI